MTPAETAKLGLRLIKEKADPVRAAGAQRYFKEPFQCYGLTAVQARGLAQQIFQMIKPRWTVEDAIQFCEILLPNPFHEAKALGILILERYRRDFPKSLFARIKGWLAKDYCNSWAAVDGLCPDAVGALLEKYPELMDEIKVWAGSPNRWVRRASIVSFLKLAKKPQHLESIYRMSASHFGDDDDLIQKANGWLLREAGKTDMKRLEQFLLKNGPSIPRTTLRYAIERFDQKKRQRLLLATK
jgi:3-methyladenine DNA glycosylase AlkD